VLLVDSSRATRDLRSETMRKLGADVDCAADISEARCWWRPDLYNLVLMNATASKTQTEKFCDDIRRLMPRQQIRFLVGGPDYLSAAPGDGSLDLNLLEADSAPLDREEKVKALLTGEGTSQHWGIFEACRRISAVRSKMEARSRAMQDLPVPKRDSEGPRTHEGPRTNPSDEAENVLATTELMEDVQ
jgi:CheY-like chemotaxis protein